MIRFVFLDLDDTILDFLKAEDASLREVLLREGIEPTEELVSLYSGINDTHWKLLEQGKLTREEVKLQRFQVFFERIGVNADAETVRRFYEARLAKSHYFIPGAEALLRDLYGKYRLYIMSNGSISAQEGRIAEAKIAPYFEQIFLSERVGYNKPKKEFFERCFAAIPDFDREEAIILGDSLTSDIQGGIVAGIKTCWFNFRGHKRNPDIIPDYEIHTLSEFSELLKQL